MLKQLSVWITSWARYNEGIEGAGWFQIVDENGNVATVDELNEFLKTRKFDINGYDEEIVIHDYEDKNGFRLFDHFGECSPFQIIEFIENIESLNDWEIDLFQAVAEAYGLGDAIEAVENGTLNDYTLYENLDDVIESYLECLGLPDDFPRSYIDMDAMERDLLMDFTETENGYLCDH